MEIEVLEIGPVAIFRPMTKRIDANKSAEFTQKYQEQLADGYKLVALNLSLVDFVDSSGLSSIVTAFRGMSTVGGTMAIFGATPTVIHLFKLTGMNRLLKIFETQDEAIAFLEGTASST